MSKAGTIAVVVLGAALTAAAAFGAGPSPGLSENGITRGDVRYVAAQGSNTRLTAMRGDGGIVRAKLLKGSWGIPLVTFDGTAGGLSADGTRLVLSDTNGVDPRTRWTSFLVVQTKTLRVEQKLRLKGGWSYDALSPNNRTLYLVEHLYASSEDPTHYRVRAYDLRAHRLLARIISDKSTWETDMQGMPISRLTHSGWEYTLYGAAGPRPFIHALDAVHATAVCIDMPWKFQPRKIWDFRLRLDRDGHLVVRGPRGRALAVVDLAQKRILRSVTNP